MNRLRCFLFAAVVLLSSTTFALGGEMQAPGKSDSTPTPTPSAMTTASTNHGPTQPKSTEGIQIVWQNPTTLLVEILLAII